MRKLLFILICVGLTACAAKKASVSGFLGDAEIYSKMQPHPSIEGVKVYRVSEKPLAEYHKFILPPVKVYLNEEGRKRNLSTQDTIELAELFHNELFKLVNEQYEVTNIPGPGVGILRLALTDADPNLALMNLHPGSLIIGGGLGGASAEFELVDSVTGATIVAGTASSKGKRYEYSRGLTKWGHTEGVLKDWAQLIRKRIDEDHGMS